MDPCDDPFTKKETMKILFPLLIVLGAIGATDAADEKPNVILIITDDQGYGDLACHGNPHLKTPHLDRLHGESIRFTDFHVSPCCSPTRAQVLTGMYPSRVGVWHTVKGRSLLDSDYLTMADLFRSNGYQTGIFGKWHLGENVPYRPQDRGFNEVVIHGGGGIGNIPDYFGNDYFDDTYLHNGEFKPFEGYCTDVFFAEAIRFMGECRQQEKPFFTYLATNAPHLPYVVGEEYRSMYRDIEAGLQEFYGMITNIDDNVGILREQLEAWGIADNTILIFMTDNGSSRGSGTFNAGMRGGKGTEWDGGHRVPFFLYWADGEITGGRDIDELTAGIDVLPTLVELCQLNGDPEVNYDGESLVPLLEGKAWTERVLVVDNQRVTYPKRYRKTAVMTERWRFLNGKELYEINEDPAQRKDVAREHPEVVATLKREFDKWWRDVYGSTKSSYPITIGSEQENSVFLTAHDLHGKCVCGDRGTDL